MIGGAPLLGLGQMGPTYHRDTPLDTPFNRKIHKEHAAAMAAGQNALRPYPTHYTAKEGGSWFDFNFPSTKFSDGSIYDSKTKSWRPDRVDPIAQWERNKAADPLASSGMIQAGEHLVREVKELRGRLLDFEMERRKINALHGDDDERDF